jgi:hypothetical protein
MFSISIVVLIALIVLAKQHQRRKLAYLAIENMQRQNIVYSDAPNPQAGNINESISSEYHRV